MKKMKSFELLPPRIKVPDELMVSPAFMVNNNHMLSTTDEVAQVMTAKFQ
jgi:hypothetical protein